MIYFPFFFLRVGGGGVYFKCKCEYEYGTSPDILAFQRETVFLK